MARLQLYLDIMTIIFSTLLNIYDKNFRKSSSRILAILIQVKRSFVHDKNAAGYYHYWVSALNKTVLLANFFQFLMVLNSS